jgi:KipI family sensor histidine kinase inhibitor
MGRVTHYGQDAFYLDLGVEDAPDRAGRTHAAAAWLRARLPDADVVVGGGVVVVKNLPRSAEVEATIAAAAGASAEAAPPGRLHVIRAVYDGPDLESMASASGLSAEEVIARHCGREVVVELVGFLPGFGYLGPIDPALVVPRRPSPRPSVPAGSIGIAGTFTGIYPFSSPGGWNLVARGVDLSLFDPAREPAILFAPGDRVRFERIAAEEAPMPSPAPAPSSPAEEPSRGLVVLSAQPGTTVQDGGRAGWLARGIPPSGPLDPELHAAANEAVGNRPSAAAIEVPLGSVGLRARGELWVSVDGEAPVRLADGEEWRIAPVSRAVRYVAVRGGIDVPAVLGSRATLLVARMGGLGGRLLRARDVLPVGAEAQGEGAGAPRGEDGAEAAVVVDPGPHVDRFPEGALEAFLSSPFGVSRLWDRVGVRLEGAKIPRDRPDLALPVPMVRGAVQVTTDGTPIVLGPDHPTTGGYPVLAVVRPSSWGAFARRRPGESVRFVLGA